MRLVVHPGRRGVRATFGLVGITGITFALTGVVGFVAGQWLGWIYLGLGVLNALVYLTATARLRVIVDDDAVTLRDGLTADVTLISEVHRVIRIAAVIARRRREPMLFLVGKLDRRLLRLAGPLWTIAELDRVAEVLAARGIEVLDEPAATPLELAHRYPGLRHDLTGPLGPAPALVAVAIGLAAVAAVGLVALVVLRVVGVL